MKGSIKRRVFVQGLACIGVLQLGESIFNPLPAQAHSIDRHPWHERVLPIMGTYVSVAIRHPVRQQALSLLSECFTYMQSLVHEISDWDSNSQTNILNTERVLKLTTDNHHLFQLLLRSQSANALTQASFQPLCKELSCVWRYSREVNRAPTTSSLKKLLSEIHQSKFYIERDSLRLSGIAQLDVGGIGKGYVSELCSKFLYSKGVQAVRVAASGDLKFLGDEVFEVQIEDPIGDANFVPLRVYGGEAISTSGGKQTLWGDINKKLHHLIDPVTGQPQNLNLQVSVVHPDACMADALATGFFMLPAATILSTVEDIKGCGAVIVDIEGRIHVSRRLRERIATMELVI